MREVLDRLRKARDLLLEARQLLQRQVPRPREEMPGYKTKQAIHWTEAEIAKLERQKEKICEKS